MKRFIPVIVLVLVLAVAPATQAAYDASTQYRAFPSSLQKSLADVAPEALPEVARVEVRKGERKMFLYDTAGNVLKSYPVSLGKNPVGHKLREGDGKTPEGRYTISGRNENSKYHLSLRISYPAKQDVRRAKNLGVDPGGDIYIHGKPNSKDWMFWKYSKGKDWTDGCIAVSDNEIRELWQLVQEGTPIDITP